MDKIRSKTRQLEAILLLLAFLICNAKNASITEKVEMKQPGKELETQTVVVRKKTQLPQFGVPKEPVEYVAKERNSSLTFSECMDMSIPNEQEETEPLVYLSDMLNTERFEVAKFMVVASIKKETRDLFASTGWKENSSRYVSIEMRNREYRGNASAVEDNAQGTMPQEEWGNSDETANIQAPEMEQKNLRQDIAEEDKTLELRQLEYERICEYLETLRVTHPFSEELVPDEREVYLLSHLIYGESGTETEASMLLTGMVVLNRKYHPTNFKNTIEGVIYQPGQYACTKDGNFQKQPSQQAYDIAYWLLQNELSGNSVYVCPGNVVFQSQARQGVGLYVPIGVQYFCYCKE